MTQINIATNMRCHDLADTARAHHKVCPRHVVAFPSGAVVTAHLVLLLDVRPWHVL